MVVDIRFLHFEVTDGLWSEDSKTVNSVSNNIRMPPRMPLLAYE